MKSDINWQRDLDLMMFHLEDHKDYENTINSLIDLQEKIIK